MYALWFIMKKNVDSAKEEIDAFEAAEGELMKIEKDLQSAESVTYPDSQLLFFLLVAWFIAFAFKYSFCKLVLNLKFVSGEGSLRKCND